MTVPVTIVSAERTTDPYGQDVADWSATRSVEARAWVGQQAGASMMTGRDQLTFDLVVWLPPGTPIGGRDRVVVFDEAYEVMAPPNRKLAPWSSAEHHVRAGLRRVEGPGADGA
jgi:head-tail adaptor